MPIYQLSKTMTEFNAILVIAYRDILKFLRDRPRILSTFIFPVVFIGFLGKSLQSNLGAQAGYDLLLFTFTGVLAQTLFQSSASGIISLIEDRQTDFSQELFVSPVSRYTIIIGKIFGESVVAFIQAAGVVIFGLIVGVNIPLVKLLELIPFALIICLFGGAFGLLVLSNLNNQRAVNQVFPLIILPQFFLSGVFAPIKNLPGYLWFLSRIAPMTYAVDLLRSVYYQGSSVFSKVVLHNVIIDLTITGLLFLLFLFVGTQRFISNERNR